MDVRPAAFDRLQHRALPTQRAMAGHSRSERNRFRRPQSVARQPHWQSAQLPARFDREVRSRARCAMSSSSQLWLPPLPARATQGFEASNRRRAGAPAGKAPPQRPSTAKRSAEASSSHARRTEAVATRTPGSRRCRRSRAAPWRRPKAPAPVRLVATRFAIAPPALRRTGPGAAAAPPAAAPKPPPDAAHSSGDSGSRTRCGHAPVPTCAAPGSSSSEGRASPARTARVQELDVPSVGEVVEEPERHRPEQTSRTPIRCPPRRRETPQGPRGSAPPRHPARAACGRGTAHRRPRAARAGRRPGWCSSCEPARGCRNRFRAAARGRAASRATSARTRRDRRCSAGL